VVNQSAVQGKELSKEEKRLTLDVGLRVDLLVVLLLRVLGVEDGLGVVLNVVDCEGDKQTEPTSEKS
jgi:hypothetical protein